MTWLLQCDWIWKKFTWPWKSCWELPIENYYQSNYKQNLKLILFFPSKKRLTFEYLLLSWGGEFKSSSWIVSHNEEKSQISWLEMSELDGKTPNHKWPYLHHVMIRRQRKKCFVSLPRYFDKVPLTIYDCNDIATGTTRVSSTFSWFCTQYFFRVFLCASCQDLNAVQFSCRYYVFWKANTDY